MTTPRLGAPELTAGQAVPESTVNEQVRYLEQGSGKFTVKDRDLATPPGSPADGDAYLVASSPTGAWSGKAGYIAFYLNTAWSFIAMKEGFSLWVEDENKFLVATSSSTFVELASAGGFTPAIQSVASSATVTPTFADDQVNITAQAAGLTLANPTGTAIPAWGLAIRIKDNGTARSIAYGSEYRAIGVTLPTTTVANKTLYLGCIWNSTDTKFDVVAVAQEA